jgi:hypothetical protein
MRGALARQHWNFSTAPFLQGPNHQSMRGLLLALLLTIPHRVLFSIFVVYRGNLNFAPQGAFAAMPKTYAAFRVAPSLILTNPT